MFYGEFTASAGCISILCTYYILKSLFAHKLLKIVLKLSEWFNTSLVLLSFNRLCNSIFVVRNSLNPLLGYYSDTMSILSVFLINYMYSLKLYVLGRIFV
jgi:hypothetical protein